MDPGGATLEASCWGSGELGCASASDLRLGTTVKVFPFLLCTMGLGAGTRCGGSTSMSSMFVTGRWSTGGCSGAGEGSEGTGESEETGEKEGEDGTAGEEGGDARAGGEEGAGVRTGDGDKGSGGGSGLVATGDGSGLDGRADVLISLSSCSFSSVLFEGVRVGVGVREVGTPGVGTTAALWEGEDLMGLDGVGLPVADEAAAWRLGITVKEFRDCRRRFARARAWVSSSGIRARSGLGEGRISKSGEERDTLEEMELEGGSARARRVSGEHGTLDLGGTSAPSQSLSLVGLICPLSGSSLGVAAVPRPPLSSNL